MPCKCPIGLALVQRLVDMHGGRISVISKPNIGAAFSFTLPSNQTTAESQARIPRADSPSAGPPPEAADIDVTPNSTYAFKNAFAVIPIPNVGVPVVSR